MRDAWRWIKYGSVAVALIALVVMGVLLDASYTENEKLNTQLDAATKVNKKNVATIEVLTTDNRDMNQLLVDRAKQQNSDKEKLNEDIEQLRKALASKECYSDPWPSDVANKLREPY